MHEAYIKRLEAVNKGLRKAILRLESQLQAIKDNNLLNKNGKVFVRQATGVRNNRRGIK